MLKPIFHLALTCALAASLAAIVYYLIAQDKEFQYTFLPENPSPTLVYAYLLPFSYFAVSFYHKALNLSLLEKNALAILSMLSMFFVWGIPGYLHSKESLSAVPFWLCTIPALFSAVVYLFLCVPPESKADDRGRGEPGWADPAFRVIFRIIFFWR